MIRVVLAPTVKNDLIKIKKYIKNELDSPQAANKLTNNIMKAIRRLSQFPAMGNPLRSVLNLETEYRFLVCENYLVFYYYKNEVVYVTHVLHGQMDFVKILFDSSIFE